MNLFRQGDFVLHSGGKSKFLIDCSCLSDADLETLALMAVERLPPFGSVEGVPQGGLRFAEALEKHVTEGGALLIVDDVLTTGKSMIVHKADRPAWGVVIFSRVQVRFVPSWIIPLFAVVS